MCKIRTFFGLLTATGDTSGNEQTVNRLKYFYSNVWYMYAEVNREALLIRGKL